MILSAMLLSAMLLSAMLLVQGYYSKGNVTTVSSILRTALLLSAMSLQYAKRNAFKYSDAGHKKMQPLTSHPCLTQVGGQKEDADTSTQKSLGHRIDRLKEATKKSHSKLCHAGESCPASRGDFSSRRRRQVRIRLGCNTRGRYPAQHPTCVFYSCLAALNIMLVALMLRLFSAFGPGVLSVLLSI